MGYTGMCHSTGDGFCLSESGVQGLQISVPVWNRVYFLPFRLWNTVWVTFLLPESCCKQMLLLFPLGSRCMYTQTCSSRFKGQLHLTFFSLEQCICFHDFVWNRVAKLCLFSLEHGQAPRHSAAHPHPKLRGVIPPPSPGGCFMSIFCHQL